MPKVTRFSGPGCLVGDIFHVRGDLRMVRVEWLPTDNRQVATFLETRTLLVELKSLEEGWVLMGVDMMMGRTALY